jgi:hypothetical protein
MVRASLTVSLASGRSTSVIFCLVAGKRATTRITIEPRRLT